MLLPTLIFFDRHDNPINMRILSKMLPGLKELGYQEYFAEQPPGFIMGHEGSLEEVIKRFYENIDPCLKVLKGCLNNLPCDVNAKIDALKTVEYNCTPDDLLQFAEQFEALLQAMDVNINTADAYKKNIAFYLEKHKDLRSRAILFVTALKFIEAIKTNNICYTPIDDMNIAEIARNYNEHTRDFETLETLDKLNEAREKTMSNAYLSANQPGFGELGINHLTGIQNALLEKITLDELHQRFIFLHLYTNQMSYDNVKKLSPKVDPICIDARVKSDDEIIQEIIEAVMVRTQSKIDSNTTNALVKESIFAKREQKSHQIVSFIEPSSP